jgi:Fur family peroxide stress response transcriptional regulator
MMMSLGERMKQSDHLNRGLARGGFRFTPHREHVYAVLLQERDHPRAEEVFIRAKREMPDISMATVYNCLDALVHCGLVRQVTLGRGAARFCPNMREHGHFYCDTCERVFDIDLPSATGVALPKGFSAGRYDIAIYGRCPACAGAAKQVANAK